MLTFQELYEAYATDVYRFALWLSGDRLDAEDITSEMFIRAWVRNGSIRTETLKAYLFTIARNVYLEQQRKRKSRIHMVVDELYPDPGPEPEKVVESQLVLKKIQRILQTMPEIDRVAFILRVQQELPYTEIARVLELSLSAAKVKVHRVRKKLIAEFVDKEGH